MVIEIYYVTNRSPDNSSDDAPQSYGVDLRAQSLGGPASLRCGVVRATVDETLIAQHLNQDLGQAGRGDGKALADACADIFATAGTQPSIHPYPDQTIAADGTVRWGSQQLFTDLFGLAQAPQQRSDVLFFIHGFSVDWWKSVARAIALKLSVQQALGHLAQRPPLKVLLFSWPADGKTSLAAYHKDAQDAALSAPALSRLLLKLRDFLQAHPDVAPPHLLVHSMGHYVLGTALKTMAEEHFPQHLIADLFTHIFLCAADISDRALEDGQLLGTIDQLGRDVTVYYNEEDKALAASKYLVGNGSRLGRSGAAHPLQLHSRVQQVDCSQVAPHNLLKKEFAHDYYLQGQTVVDIARSIVGWTPSDARRSRLLQSGRGPSWILSPTTTSP